MPNSESLWASEKAKTLDRRSTESPWLHNPIFEICQKMLCQPISFRSNCTCTSCTPWKEIGLNKMVQLSLSCCLSVWSILIYWLLQQRTDQASAVFKWWLSQSLYLILSVSSVTYVYINYTTILLYLKSLYDSLALDQNRAKNWVLPLLCRDITKTSQKWIMHQSWGRTSETEFQPSCTEFHQQI